MNNINTLKELTCSKIIEVLRNNIIINGDVSRVGLTVLVVDNYVLSLLNTTIGLSNVIDIGYLLVDLFETDDEISDGKRRRSYPGLDVVYFFADRELSVNRICLDYRIDIINKQPTCIDRLLACTLYRGVPAFPVQVSNMYRDARIITIENFNVTSVYDDLIVRRRNEKGHLDLLLTHIKRDTVAEECIINYIAWESNTFTLEFYDTLSILYSYKLGMSPHSNIIKKAKRSRNEHIKIISHKLASVFMVLNNLPNIRFRNSEHSQSCSKEVAYQVAKELYKYRDTVGFTNSKNSKDSFGNDKDLHNNFKNNCTLLIVDRIDDVVPALLHDFSYSSLLVDLLDHDPILPFLYKYIDKKNREKEMEIMLDECDCVYQELRYLEIMEISKKIEYEVNEQAKKNSNNKSKTELEAAKDALLKLVNNEDLINTKYSQHIDITNDIYKSIDARNLAPLMILEQELVTGVDNNGSKISHNSIIDRVKIMLTKDSDTYLSKRIDQLRILLLLVICVPELSKSTLKELISLSKIETQGECVINNLANIHIPVCKNKKHVNGAPIINRDIAKKRAEEFMKIKKHSRYMTKLEDAVLSLIKNDLPIELFPYQHENSNETNETNGTDEITISSKIKHDSKRTRHSKIFKQNFPVETKTDKNCIVVFVVGGITQMEINALKKISLMYNKNIIIGSTSMLSQNDFITQLVETKNFNDYSDDTDASSDEESNKKKQTKNITGKKDHLQTTHDNFMKSEKKRSESDEINIDSDFED